MRTPILTLLLGSLALASASGADEARQAPSPTSAAQLLPSTITAYVEIADPNGFAERLLQNPLRDRVESLASVQKGLQSPAATHLRSVLALLDAGMGQRWPKTLSTLTHGGVVVAFDFQTKGIVLLAQSRDRETLERLRDTAVSAFNANQSRRPLRVNDYRGIQAYAIQGDGRIAILQNWLLVTNRAELGKRIADQFLDGEADCLAAEPTFVRARAIHNEQAGVWGFVNLEQLRAAGIARELFQGRAPQVLAEMLIGGVLGDLQHADFATAALNVFEQNVSLSIQMPHSGEANNGSRAYFFSGPESAGAPALLDPPHRIMAASLHRDLSQMWLRADDLLTERGNDQLAKADSQLTTFFSGRDFGEDILGALESDIQVAVVRQSFTDRTPQPAIKLPAFAMQFLMKTPEATVPDLRRTFQSFVGFFNVIGAMNGQPQLDLDMQLEQGIQVVSARFLPDVDEGEATEAAIHFNFSPTLAFAGQRVVLASTRELANELIGTEPEVARTQSAINSQIELQAPTLLAVLNDNREQLIAQNMLNEGHNAAEATQDIDGLFELIGLFRNAELQLKVEDNRLQLEVDANLIKP